METFELWSYDVNGMGDFAEHTYIRCPERDAYFDCWGGHRSPIQGPGIHRFSCSGLFEVANCYRRPAFGLNDTAGIGVYGVNGVCHQTANLFLCSAERVITIEDGVKGYWLSSLAYGTYGDAGPFAIPLQPIFFADWKMKVYNQCYHRYALGEKDAGYYLLQDIKKLHSSVLRFKPKIDFRELIHQEAATVARQALPDFNTDLFRDIHLDFLKEKMAFVKRGFKGEALANKINDVAVQFQRTLAQRIGGEAYEKLTGQKAGETIHLVNPIIAAKVK